MNWSRPLTSAAAAVAVLTLSASAGANPWNETTDAGDLLSSAQQVTVAAPSIIFGDVATTTDADLFALQLTSGVTFTATTVSFGGAAGLIDSQLFLFDATGHGIRYNDDITVLDFLSSLTFTPTTSGVYYLGISGAGYNPRDGGSGSFIYQSDPSDPTATPGASQYGPLASWASVSGAFSDFGPYRINLAGAAPIPEPSTIALMALGLAGLFGARRWIKT